MKNYAEQWLVPSTERFRNSTEHDVIQVLATHAPIVAHEIVALIPERSDRTVYRALRSLQVKGVAMTGGPNNSRAIWELTTWGKEIARTGYMPKPSVPPDDPAEARTWSPKPWVHPIRAKALGL